MSNKVKYKAKFLDEWLENYDFKDWIQKHRKAPTCAFCNFNIAKVRDRFSYTDRFWYSF